MVVGLALLAGGYVGYVAVRNQSIHFGARQAVESFSKYLNKSNARFTLDSCDDYGGSGATILDVGGKYNGVWRGNTLIGICN